MQFGTVQHQGMYGEEVSRNFKKQVGGGLLFDRFLKTCTTNVIARRWILSQS
jgi:hypothetical protein